MPFLKTGERVRQEEFNKTVRSGKRDVSGHRNIHKGVYAILLSFIYYVVSFAAIFRLVTQRSSSEETIYYEDEIEMSTHLVH